jgi:hypothetical protein
MGARVASVVFWIVIGAAALFCVLFLALFFTLLPGVSLLEAHACLTRPTCAVYTATRMGAPITGHFEGGATLAVAALLLALAYLVSWLATTGLVHLAGTFAPKPWHARFTSPSSPAAHALALAWLFVDAIVIRLVAGPPP